MTAWKLSASRIMLSCLLRAIACSSSAVWVAYGKFDLYPSNVSAGH
jgi:hypothetical protein